MGVGVLLPQNTHTTPHNHPHPIFTLQCLLSSLGMTVDETNGQAETIALGCESLHGEVADIVVGCRRHGAFVHLEDNPSPTQGPGHL